MPENYGPWVLTKEEGERLCSYKEALSLVTDKQGRLDLRLLRDRMNAGDYRLPSMWVSIPDLICSSAADLVLPSEPVFKSNDPETQTRIDAIVKRSKLSQAAWRAVYWTCAQGDAFFKITDVSKKKQSVPVISLQRATETVARNIRVEDSPETSQLLIKTCIPGGHLYQVLIAGKNLYFAFDNENNPMAVPAPYQPELETGEERMMAVHLGAMRADAEGNGFGQSDFSSSVCDLLFEVAHRFRQISSILDRHAEPIMNAPAGVLNEKSEFDPAKKKVIEIGEGGEKAEFMTWQSQLSEAYAEIDRLMQLVMLLTGTSPAQWGLDKDGKVESGRALKFKLLASLGKARRNGTVLVDGLTSAIQLALRREDYLASRTMQDYDDITVTLPTTFIADEMEESERVRNLRGAGAMSIEEAVQVSTGYTGERLDTEVQRIKDEQPAAPMGADNFAPLTPGA